MNDQPQAMPLDVVDAFTKLYAGNTESYGRTLLLGTQRKDGKEEVNCKTVTAKVTPDLYVQHLCGRQSLGIVPVDAEGLVKFCAIDVDDYALEPARFVRMITTANLPILPVRTKSGGLHLYMFFSAPVKAKALIPLLQQIRAMFGLPEDTEIFPKQSSLKSSHGSWINLPYFDYTQTTRFAYDSHAQPMSIEAFIAVAVNMQTDLQRLSQALSDVPFAEGPPCLQAIYLDGASSEGCRNIFLFNVATYLKAVHRGNFIKPLMQINARLPSPLDDGEIYHTVIKSQEKSEYAYQCTEGALAMYCNKALCYEKKYGKDSGNISNLTFEQLVQVRTSKPYYLWTINGVEMQFNDESQLTDQRVFRRLCLRHLHVYPNQLKEDKWVAVLNRALKNIVINAVDKLDELSDNSLWTEAFKEYISRSRGVRPSQVDDGLIYEADGNVYLKGPLLLAYLKGKYNLKTLSNADHNELLKSLGGKATKIYCQTIQRQVRVWEFEVEALKTHGVTVEPVTLSDEELNYKEPDYKGEF